MVMNADRKELRSKLKAILENNGAAVPRPGNQSGRVTRRNFLHLGAMAGAGASWTGAVSGTTAPRATGSPAPGRSDAPDTFNEATIAQLQAAMGRTIA
jgi:hypothetical protein